MGARSGGTGRTAKTSHTDENAKKASQQLAADKKEQAKLEAKVKNSEAMDYNAGFNAEDETYDNVAENWIVKNNTDMGVRQAFKEFGLDKFGLNNYKTTIEKAAKAAGIEASKVYANVAINQTSCTISYEVESKDGMLLMAHERTIRRTNFGTLEAYQSLLQIEEDYQGKGIAQKIYRENLKSYKRMGVDKMTIKANMDVGGYAWSKYGFEMAGGKKGMEYFMDTELKYKSRVKPLVDEFYKTHKPTENFPMEKIGYTPWGKNVLLGTEWPGVLNLKDKRQVAIYESYLRSKEKKYENTESKK